MKEDATVILTHCRDEAVDRLAEARDKLAREAATKDSHDLAYALAALAEQEGRLFVHASVTALVEAGHADQINAWLV